MSEEVYLKLREFLDNKPGGYPVTPTGVEMKILKKLFSPEEARIAMLLSHKPETVDNIAPRLGLDGAAAATRLESMAQKGLIFRLRDGDRNLYMSAQFVVGIYEYQLNTLDSELAHYMEEYFPFMTRVWEQAHTPQLRVIPVQTAVSAAPAVAPYDQIYELVKDKSLISVSTCICRKEKGLAGAECDRPHETCFGFDHAAQYYIDNGLGRRISVDELMEIVKLGEKNGLVVSPANALNIGGLCLCCGCCCGILRGFKSMERPIDHVQTSFQASINAETCSACGTCLERCQVNAIVDAGRAYEVNPVRCIGCGLCVSTCPEEAISLIARAEVTPIPTTFAEASRRIAKERGLN